MKGNLNAEKLTEDVVIDLLTKMLEYVNSNEVYTLASIMAEFGLYEAWWAYVTNKFSDNDFVFKAIKGIESVIERNIIHNTMTGDAKSAAMAIFLLKNKYGYKDKTETEHSGEIKVQPIFNLKD